MTTKTKTFWESYSETYQDTTPIPVGIHYGPSSPNEDELNLMGDLTGREVLEIGCGGAQCSIAFALKGARVTALDLSAEQLQFAQDLAAEHQVEIEWVQHDMSDLAPIASDSKDIVFSAFALQWLADLTPTFREARRVLRPGGLFVFSLDHPFFRKVDPESLKLVESYNETGASKEVCNDFAEVTLYRYKIGDLHRYLVDAGFRVERMIEPDSRIRYDYDPWFGRRDAYVPKLLDMLTPTIIFKSVKPES